MLRKALAILLLIAVAVVFLAAPEGDAVAWLDWLRDPDGSRRAHSEYVARERERERLEAERGEPSLDSSARGTRTLVVPDFAVLAVGLLAPETGVTRPHRW